LVQVVPTVEQAPPELLPEDVELVEPPLLVLPPLLVPPELEVPPLVLAPELVELPLEVEPLLVEPLLLEPLLPELPVVAAVLDAVPLELPLLDPLLLEPLLDEPPTVRQPMPASVSVQIAPVQQSEALTHGQGGTPSPGLQMQTLAPPS
jgi:hypothetical protein